MHIQTHHINTLDGSRLKIFITVQLNEIYLNVTSRGLNM